jgi:N-acetylglucosamine transport system permease protein
MLLDWDTSLNTIFGQEFLLNNRFMLALIYASTALPFTIYLLSSYFKTLPSDFEEAASIDGAGYYRTMFSVMFPMAAPSIVIVILFNFLLFWNEYILALTLMPAKNQTLPVGLLNLMAAERAAVNYGPLYAGMVIVMLPTLILYILVQKRLTEGMTVGGVKG